jgi:hypothetical protein
MLHVMTLYSVTAEAVGPFIRSIRRGGEWHTLARDLAPALIATDLLERQSSPAPPFHLNSTVLFLCIDFWTSPVAYRRDCHQPACQTLLLARRRMASCAFELGAFCFPAPMERESLAPPAGA